jgi:nitrogen fixation protein FixH
MQRLFVITALVLMILALLPACQPDETSPSQPEVSAAQLSLEIRSPRDGEESRKTPIRIRGTVSHPEAEVTANGIKAEVEANGFFSSDWVPLEEGENKIKVIARLADEEVSQTITVTYNLVLSVSLSLPRHTQEDELTESPTTASGRVSDPRARVTVNGREAVVAHDGTYSIPLDLVEGNNFVEAVATLGEHQAHDSTTAVFRPPKPLALEIKSPKDGATSNVDLIKVSGVIAEPDDEVTVNGITAQVADDGPFYAYIELAEGKNTVEAVVVRGEERLSEAISVIYSPPSPGMVTNDLSLEIDYPEDGAEFKVNLQRISGTVSNPQATVVVNGIEAKVAENGSYYTWLDLGEGKNTITATALKGTARVSQTVTVTFTPPLVVYLDAEPELGVDYTKTPLAVTGMVNRPEANVTVNGEAITVTPDGSFTAQALLNEGSSKVEAVATLGGERDEVYILYMVENGILGHVPGYSHFFAAREKYEQEITITAGEKGSIDILLETRKSGPGEYSGKAFYVSGEYSKEALPMPEELEVSLEPNNFKTYPNTTYHATLIIQTDPALAPGEYYLRFVSRFVRGGTGYSSGWIRVTIE